VNTAPALGAFTNSQIRRLGDYEECCAFYYYSAFSASPCEIKLAPGHECAPGNIMAHPNSYHFEVGQLPERLPHVVYSPPAPANDYGLPAREL